MKKVESSRQKKVGGNISDSSGVRSQESEVYGLGSITDAKDLGVSETLLKLISHSPEETRSIGVELGKRAQDGQLYLLTGNLGAGKTCLTQGIAWGIGFKGYIASPSFVIMREYLGRFPLYHVDLYRMESVKEIGELGLDDYLYGKGICVIEWANRGWEYPGDYLSIDIKIKSPEERLLYFQGVGKQYATMVKSLQETFRDLVVAH